MEQPLIPPMEAHDFFLALLIILVGARIFRELAERFGAPAVLGELFAGIFLGPSLLGWIEPSQAMSLLAEIGIILLLFDVGLETDIKRLGKRGWQSISVAVIGFMTPLALGFWVTHVLFGESLLIALFVGGTITATSIGITVRVLNDLELRDSDGGEIVLGAAVLDDILGVVLLAFLFEFSREGVMDFTSALQALVLIVIFFIMAPIFAKLFSLFINYFDDHTKRHDVLPTAVFSLVLFLAWLAHQIGAPEIIGGFAAGLALSRRFFLPFGMALRGNEHFSVRLESQIRPIVYLFTPIFFVTVGLSMNLQMIDWSSAHLWYFGGAIFIVALLGKLFSGAVLRGLPWRERFIVGFSMVPRGEVGLIFAEIGRSGEILDMQTYTALIFVIVLTTVLAPFAIKAIAPRASG